MQTILTITFCLLLGFLLLGIGSNLLIKGSQEIATKFNVHPLIIGITVVAIGTSLPEIFTTSYSILKGNHTVALSNLVGSNVANVCLILGLSSCIYPIKSNGSLFLEALLSFIIGTIIFVILAFNGALNAIDGSVLITLLILFITRCIKKQEYKRKPNKNIEQTFAKIFLKLLASIPILTFGLKLAMDNAFAIIELFNLQASFVGFFIVAVGTSLPELITSLYSVIKKQPYLGFGNILGSNLFNLLLVGGGSALLTPLKVNNLNNWRIELAALLISSSLLFFLCLTKNILSRLEGFFLLSIYIIFLISRL